MGTYIAVLRADMRFPVEPAVCQIVRCHAYVTYIIYGRPFVGNESMRFREGTRTHSCIIDLALTNTL
jgi:hypothetical protein